MVEQPLKGLPEDSQSPNFFTINAAGEVTAEFEGVIVAKGLVFTEGGGVEPISSIRWLREGIGREIIVGYLLEEIHTLSLVSQVNESGGNNAILQLRSKQGDRANTGIKVFTITEFATLLTDLGESSFPRLSAVRNSRLIRGSVSGAGVKLDGEGFVVERTAAGKYTITLSTVLANKGIIVLSGSGGAIISSTPSSTQVFKVETLNPAEAAFEDRAFNFIIMS